MGPHDRSDEMHVDEESDSGVPDLLRRAYSCTVDIDTAARHLWAIDVAARAARRSAAVLRTRRAVASALTGLLVLGTSGVAVAASGAALPGDALYPLKRGTERVQLVMAIRPEADARVHLTIAEKRWAEAQQVVATRPGAVASLLKETFDALGAAERRSERVAARAVALRMEVTAGSAGLAFGRSHQPSADPGQRGNPRRGGASSPLPAEEPPVDEAGPAESTGALTPAAPTATPPMPEKPPAPATDTPRPAVAAAPEEASSDEGPRTTEPEKGVDEPPGPVVPAPEATSQPEPEARGREAAPEDASSASPEALWPRP